MVAWGVHTRYVTGEPKTRLRGWIHGIEFCSLSLVLLAGQAHPRSLVFWSGKLLSCGASAMLHLKPHEALREYCMWDAIDWGCIPLAALSGCILWTPPHLARALAALVFTLIPPISYASWNQAEAYGRKEWAREKVFRRIQTALQIFVLTVCAMAQGMECFGVAYLAQLAVYTSGLSLWVLQDTLGAPWHVRQTWGGHEDFHLCVLIGDLGNYALLASRGRL